MNGVEFHEERDLQVKKQPTSMGLIGFVLKTGITKNPKVAEGVLIALVIIALVGSFLLFQRTQQEQALTPAPPPAGFSE